MKLDYIHPRRTVRSHFHQPRHAQGKQTDTCCRKSKTHLTVADTCGFGRALKARAGSRARHVTEFEAAGQRCVSLYVPGDAYVAALTDRGSHPNRGPALMRSLSRGDRVFVMDFYPGVFVGFLLACNT
jgi:hypothetical protein